MNSIINSSEKNDTSGVKALFLIKIDVLLCTFS
jgi:hypothetical protein